jgi:pimeloyl-ACP methyl ester carboxylesterase
VVLVHGLNRSRIEMVRKTPFLNRKGWNALLFDLRHHGKSGGTVSSFGHFEKQDVHAAADWARARSSGPVVLWGVSLGGAAATLAAAEDPSVAALVCDSS